MYLVTLHTEESDGRRGKVSFSCSLAQLTHLVTRLRQASRCVQKYASNSWLSFQLECIFSNISCCSYSTNVGANFLSLLLFIQVFLFSVICDVIQVNIKEIPFCSYYSTMLPGWQGCVRDGNMCNESLHKESRTTSFGPSFHGCTNRGRMIIRDLIFPP